MFSKARVDRVDANRELWAHACSPEAGHDVDVDVDENLVADEQEVQVQDAIEEDPSRNRGSLSLLPLPLFQADIAAVRRPLREAGPAGLSIREAIASPLDPFNVCGYICIHALCMLVHSYIYVHACMHAI